MTTASGGKKISARLRADTEILPGETSDFALDLCRDLTLSQNRQEIELKVGAQKISVALDNCFAKVKTAFIVRPFRCVS